MKYSEISDRDQILIDYLKSPSQIFNPYSHWRDFADWASHYKDGSGEIVQELEKLSEKIISAADYEEEISNIMDLDPSLYFKLPMKYKKEFEETETLETGNSHQAFRLLSDKKLPADTLLIHFTDQPEEIIKHGFCFGIPDMHLLGETVRLPNWMKQKPGYNFAYLYNQNDYGIQNGAWKRHSAVLFRHTGVSVQHFGDREHQIIFWGPYVDKKSIKIIDV